MSDVRREERLARVTLSRLTEPGDPRLASLTAQLGAVRLCSHLVRETQDDMLTQAAARVSGVDAERDLEQAARIGIRFVIPGDDEWPTVLDDLDHCEQVQHRGGAPIGLWVKGPLRLHEHARSVALVGSRSATSQGCEIARGIAADCAGDAFTVVSGAAFGIDQAAHRGALAGGGPTIAVLACGVDRAYPQAHKNLLDHIAGDGAVVSELAPGCSPTRMRFLARNRLIAALTQGTVVVEAAIRSGALNTANWADRLSRRLMAVPGSVTSPQSAGAHHLIRNGAATLVTRGSEVLELLDASGRNALEEPRAATRPRDRLPRRDAQVLEAVPVARAAGADSIAATAGLALLHVQTALERLARDGFVLQTPRGWRLAEKALA